MSFEVVSRYFKVFCFLIYKNYIKSEHLDGFYRTNKKDPFLLRKTSWGGGVDTKIPDIYGTKVLFPKKSCTTTPLPIFSILVHWY